MIENIIVIGIVAVVAALTVRGIYRTVSGKNKGCSCGGGCYGCAESNSEKMLPGKEAVK